MKAYLLAFLYIGSFFYIIFSTNRLPQDPNYHHFADQRSLNVFGFVIPNWQNVLTNLPISIAGVVGLVFSLQTSKAARSYHAKYKVPSNIQKSENVIILVYQMCFFYGVCIGVGSAYYHWNLNYDTLLWDRLPMIACFSLVFCSQLAERTSPTIGLFLTLFLFLIGIFSVVFWYFANDLRPYLFLQFSFVFTFPFLYLLESQVKNLPRPAFSSRDVSTKKSIYIYSFCAVFLYALAKYTEYYDQRIFESTHHLFSGHAFKHVVGGMSLYFLVLLFKIVHLDRYAITSSIIRRRRHKDQ